MHKDLAAVFARSDGTYPGGMNSGTSSSSPPAPPRRAPDPRSARPEDRRSPSAIGARPGQPDRPVDPVDLGHHPRVDRLDVAQEPLGVRAQRVAHLAQVADQLETLGVHIAGRGPGLAQELTGALLGVLAHLRRLSGGLGDGLSGVLLRLGHDRQRLAGGGGLRRLALVPRRGEHAGCLGLGVARNVGGLLLGRPHAIVGRAVGLGDAVAQAPLGLLA